MSRRQLLGHLLVHPNHLTGEEVEHDGQVQPALAGPDVADVGQPDRVRRRDRELPIQPVGRDWMIVTAVGGDLELALGPGPDVVFAHQSGHPFAADPVAFRLACTRGLP